MICSSAAVIIALISASANSARADATRLDQLTGEWALVSTQDAKKTDRGHDDCRLSIQASGEITLRIGELTTNSGKIAARRVDETNQVDFHLKTGVVLGIFERRGDTLIICCDREVNGRPTTLHPQRTQWRETWRLVKPRPSSCVQP